MADEVKTWKPDGSTLMLLDTKFPDTEGGSMRVYGHVHFGPFPKIGDEALIEGKEGGSHFFRFTKIDHCHDPREMYFADIKRYRVDFEGATIWQETPPKEGPIGLLSPIRAVKSLLSLFTRR